MPTTVRPATTTAAAPGPGPNAAPGTAPGVADASLAAILAIAADAIITVDEDYRVVQFNRGAEEIFGYRADEILGRPLEVLIPERFRVVHRGHVTDFAAAAHPARRMGERREIWALARGAREFPAEASISKVDAPGGRLYTVVLRDVSARHRAAVAERLLAAAGGALARSLDLAETARTAAAAGVPTLAGAAVAVLPGAALPGDAGRSAAAASPHADPDVASLLEALAAEGAGGTLWGSRGEGGGPDAVDALPPAVPDAAPSVAPARLVVVRDDVGGWIARHAATPAVRALALALRPRAVLVARLRAAGDRRGVGELTWFALPGGRVPGSGPDGAPALVPDAGTRDVPNGMPNDAPDAGRDGATAAGPFDAADVALAAALAERVALAAVAARLYGDARRAVRARDEVLAVVSHDLRNPLSTVAMCAAALQTAGDRLTSDRLTGGPDEGAEVRAVADTVREAVQWMQAIIDDLLEVARLEGGRLALRRAPVDAAALVARATELHAPLAAAAGVTLRAHAAPALPPLDADAERLLRALGNLVGNAVKFTAAGGRVDVEARPGPAGATELVVADTGCGIAAEHLPHLFERFWQAREQRRGGAGLGLAIAKGIADAHGGTLRVASAVGAGTTFTLTLPAAPPPGGPAGSGLSGEPAQAVGNAPPVRQHPPD